MQTVLVTGIARAIKMAEAIEHIGLWGGGGGGGDKHMLVGEPQHPAIQGPPPPIFTGKSLVQPL